MNRLHNKTLSRLINIGLLATCLVLAYVLFRNYYHKPAAPPPTQRASGSEELIGKRLTLSNVDWARANKTVVIAVKSDCAFCRDSIPFYERLSRVLASRSDVQTIVLLPDGDKGIEESANDLGFNFKEVRNVSFPSTLGALGVTGVPSLLIVDKNGTVSQAWQGLLTQSSELQVLKALGVLADDLEPDSDVGIERITASMLRKMMKTGERVTVIDVRDRDAYSRGHFDEAVNIPQDELSVRAINELNQSDLIAIYAYSNGDSLVMRSYLALKKEGFKKVLELDRETP